MQRRRLSALAAATALAVLAGACSTSADTTAVDVESVDGDLAAPTSTIVRTEPSTTVPPTTVARAATAATAADPTAVLTSLLAQVAVDPALLAQLGQLDAVGIANLTGLDLGALQQLGLTPDQLTSLAQGVVASAPDVQADLASGVPDPAVLLGLLAGSLDAASLADGTIATIVQALIAAISGTRIVVSPEVSFDLGELLGDLDPEQLGPIVANPSNASLLALLTSVWLGSNPLFTQQLLANPALDPSLRELLSELQKVSDSIGETARTALLEALYALIPALDPTP